MQPTAWYHICTSRFDKAMHRYRGVIILTSLTTRARGVLCAAVSRPPHVADSPVVSSTNHETGSAFFFPPRRSGEEIEMAHGSCQAFVFANVLDQDILGSTGVVLKDTLAVRSEDDAGNTRATVDVERVPGSWFFSERVSNRCHRGLLCRFANSL
jgi:hypothetical protein